MPVLLPADVRKQIATGDVQPLYLLIGPDEADAWVPLEERIAYEPLREGLD